MDGEPQSDPANPASEPSPEDDERKDRDEQIARAAERVGGMLGRLSRRVKPEAERLAERAGPEAERLAQQARAAAEAARPHLERAGREAVQFARDHDQEIRGAARTAAEIAAQRLVPLPLRPLVDAVEEGRREARGEAGRGAPREAAPDEPPGVRDDDQAPGGGSSEHGT